MCDDVGRLRQRLSAGPPLRLVVLFGSRAAGAGRPDSDWDVAILPRDPELPLSEELRLVADLEEAVASTVDLVRLDRASTLLKWAVATQGVVLRADPASEWARFVAGAACEHADFAEGVAAAAELFRRRLAGER